MGSNRQHLSSELELGNQIVSGLDFFSSRLAFERENRSPGRP
jgi:hypothetical protein